MDNALERAPRDSALAARRIATLSGRDVIRPVFRHGRVALALLVLLSALAVIATLAWPQRYVGEMKILVKHDRVEPLVTPDRNEAVTTRQGVSDSDINSEVALLTSRDLLEQVAVAAGLVTTPKGVKPSPLERSRAVRALERDLQVQPIRRAALIGIAYSAPDPQTATRVLLTLSRLYLEKHLAVHRAPGAHAFFTQQAARLRGDLEAAEKNLLEFGTTHHVVSAASERDAALQRLAEFQATFEQLRAQIADADRRLESLQQQLATTPERLATQERRQDNPELIGQLTARVLDLELKRTEMLRKFTPSYPPVVELEQQLAQARGTLAAARQSPMKDEMTDRNPTYQWLRNEVARVQAERQALEARASATTATIKEYEARARDLDESGTAQQDLQRQVKAAEENYLLYQRKAEESRISDALDEQRIANVSLAEAPTTPPIPSTSRRFVLAVGLLVALLVSLTTTFLLEYFNPRFRTRDEVEAVLDLPVLAAIPVSLRR